VITLLLMVWLNGRYHVVVVAAVMMWFGWWFIISYCQMIGLDVDTSCHLAALLVGGLTPAAALRVCTPCAGGGRGRAWAA